MKTSLMMRGAALAAVLATAALVQGCSTAPPVTSQQAMAPNTGIYSGPAWYEDLDAMMTSGSAGE